MICEKCKREIARVVAHHCPSEPRPPVRYRQDYIDGPAYLENCEGCAVEGYYCRGHRPDIIKLGAITVSRLAKHTLNIPL